MSSNYFCISAKGHSSNMDPCVHLFAADVQVLTLPLPRYQLMSVWNLFHLETQKQEGRKKELNMRNLIADIKSTVLVQCPVRKMPSELIHNLYMNGRNLHSVPEWNYHDPL